MRKAIFWLVGLASIGLAVAFVAPRPSNPKSMADVTTLLERQFPDNRSVTIVFHGHSVPAGYAQTPVVDTMHAYPQLLLAKLKAKYPYAIINVVVTAIGSETSDQGAARMGDVLRHAPDVVMIDYGVNDRKIGLARAKAAWESMIEEAQSSGAAVVLLTPTVDTSDKSDAVKQHADQIRELAAIYHTALADSWSAFQAHAAARGSVDDLMVTPNHPNAAGHELVADVLAAIFEKPGH